MVHSTEYAKRVLPHLKFEYFETSDNQIIFEECKKYWDGYNSPPSLEALAIEIDNIDGLSDEKYTTMMRILDELSPAPENLEWMIDKTEEWIKDRAIHNAIMNSIAIIDGDTKDETVHSIPALLSEALAVTMETRVGHDYLEDAAHRFEMYGSEVERIPFDIEMLNVITNGGVPRATLNVILGATNVGKTMSMVHLAAAYVRMGIDTLYISMEMSEVEIGRRVDANMFDIKINDVEHMDRSSFIKGIKSIRAKTSGSLKIVQFPTSGAHAGHFKSLVEEYKMTMNFKPQVILIDYLGICASSRVPAGSPPHILVKSIAEELRGLAIELNTPIWSAHQLNRNGLSNTDADLGDIADSYALSCVCDFILVAIRTEELDAVKRIKFKQLKSRYGNKSENEVFVLGVEPDKQRLSDPSVKTQSFVGGSTAQQKLPKLNEPPVPVRRSRRALNKNKSYD